MLAGHALTSAVGPDILAARYLLSLIPLGVVVLAAGVVATPWRAAVPLASVILVAAAFLFAHRDGRELDPDYGRVAALVENAHAKVVLTNSPVVTYYLDRPRPHLDRAFGLGPGLAVGCREICPLPFAVVDDRRIPPPRKGLGRPARVDEISVAIVRTRRPGRE